MKAPQFKIRNNCEILYFDTEQSREDIRRFGKMVLSLAGNHCLPNINYYSLRGLSPPEKLLLISKLVRRTIKSKLVVIDNLRDVCFDINNQKEAMDLITSIQRLVDEGHHFVLVLHVTRGTEDAARGAIGTEAMNRAENVYTIIKDGNKSIVRPILTRGKAFEEFAFEVNGEGLPFLIEDWIKTPVSKGKLRQKLIPGSISDADHLEVIKKVFYRNSTPILVKRADLVKNVKDIFKGKGVEFGDNKSREFIAYFLEKEWIGKRTRVVGTRKVEEYGIKAKS